MVAYSVEIPSSANLVKQKKWKEEELENLAKDFAVNKISAAGISYIINSRTFLRRFLWFIGVMDVIRLKLPFPAVTVCSLNPISTHYVPETSLKNLLHLKKMMEDLPTERSNASIRHDCHSNPLCKWSWFQEVCECVDNPCLTEFCLAESSSHCSCSSFFCKNVSVKFEGCETVSDYSNPPQNETCQCTGNTTQQWRKESTNQDINDLLATIKDQGVKNIIRLIKMSESYDLVDIEEALIPSISELYQYGVTFDDLVAACSFEGTRCYRENFTILYHPSYGKCYMFNYVGNKVPRVGKPIEITRYGSKSGLQLLLRVSDLYELDLLRREIGARIIIHDTRMLPFVDEYGVNVRPKDMTSVELSLTETERLGKPWGNCEEEIKTMYNGDPYSLLGCEKYCGYIYMTEHCNCTMRHFISGSALNRLLPPYGFCNITDEKTKECVAEAYNNIEGMSRCNCKPPCRETVYSYTVTSSKLNENFYKTAKAIRTLRVDSRGQKKHMNYSDERLMIGVKVYYNTFQVSKYNEVASYSWETLVANVGGNLSFIMGLTLVTFLEVTEFIWDFFRIACDQAPPDNKVHKLSTT
ncbi:amiloride-sensitive sodium channel subunit beta [Nephila pilipes]|uniref:Amiloride-sensitive sodium channel subunit beta n=1 Tax=Nephila pilipes TaxID=299642 RepID=A0A8X6UHY2_NEPPI|nr:amiloride-sensitive sodium channel subunit beta [Nephila pilipes]